MTQTDDHAPSDRRASDKPLSALPDDAHLDERRRLAEAQIAEQEARKVRAEAEEAELRTAAMRRGSLTPRILTQAAVGGVVAAGLLAAWGIGYLQPVLSANTTLAAIENRILTAENILLEREKDQLEKDKQTLFTRKTALDARVLELDQQNEQFKRQVALIGDSAEVQLSGLREASDEANNLRQQIEQLKGATRTAEARSTEIADLRLASYKIVIQEQYFEQPVGEKIARELADRGIESRRVYTRGGGDNEVIWAKARVDQESRKRLLGILGPSWQFGEGVPHAVVGTDWDIVVNPSPPG